MRTLHEIARELRDELALTLPAHTEDSRRFVGRVIEDFDEWEKRNKAQVEYRKLAKSAGKSK